MYKCLECGHIFDKGEEANWIEKHGFADGPFEHFTGCPICKSAYEETTHCNACGGEYLEDELFDGKICRDCLMKKITVENTNSYLLYAGIEKEFYMEIFLDSTFSKVSPRLLEISKMEFDRYAQKNPIEAISICKSYVACDDAGLYDFSEFIARSGR